MRRVILSRHNRALRRISFCFAALIWFATCISCSVKEVRDNCPSLLMVETSMVETNVPLNINIWGDGSYHLHDRFILVDYPEHWDARVKKGYNAVSCYIGVKKSILEEQNQIRIPLGEESDRLYTHLEIVDCMGEYSYDTLAMHKQFCILTLDCSEIDFSKMRDVEIRINGNACGYNLSTGMPIPGSFYREMILKEDESPQVALPRQFQDDSLELKLFFDGKEVGSMALDKELTKMGYSWDKIDLDDVTVKLSAYFLNTHLNVVEWGEGVVLNNI
ncbi:MAG: hypothetical protein HUJ90_03795 [Bacteroidales bacterium]|nr:hypothetical protein [Bacteroidales bacterium]